MHKPGRLMQKNGFNQVGNTTLPAHQISSARVTKSAIFNKNLNGIGEAGYGQRFPFRHLAYAGAGSPRNSILKGLAYAGAGSPRNSILRGLAYAGAGSPRNSILKDYHGAGSPRYTVLRDAYINDNPPPGSLKTLPPAQMLKRSVSGLADDIPAPVDTGTMEGPSLPPSVAPTQSSLWGDITGAFGSIFSTTVGAGTAAADTSIIGAITGTSSSPTKSTSAVPLSTARKTIMGISTGTLTLVGLGALAYYVMKK